jgi:hypothetical protein
MPCQFWQSSFLYHTLSCVGGQMQWMHCHVRAPGQQLKQIITGARPKISQRHRLCTHNRTYNLDYVSN